MEISLLLLGAVTSRPHVLFIIFFFSEAVLFLPVGCFASSVKLAV